MDDTSKVFPPQPPTEPPPPIPFVSGAEAQRPTHYAASSVFVPPQEPLTSGTSPGMKKPKPKPSGRKREDQSRHKPRSRSRRRS